MEVANAKRDGTEERATRVAIATKISSRMMTVVWKNSLKKRLTESPSNRGVTANADGSCNRGVDDGRAVFRNAMFQAL